MKIKPILTPIQGDVKFPCIGLHVAKPWEAKVLLEDSSEYDAYHLHLVDLDSTIDPDKWVKLSNNMQDVIQRHKLLASTNYKLVSPTDCGMLSIEVLQDILNQANNIESVYKINWLYANVDLIDTALVMEVWAMSKTYPHLPWWVEGYVNPVHLEFIKL